MDDIPEELWSSAAPSYPLQNSEISSSAMKMRIPSNASELDFQRFLQEFAVDQESYPFKPPPSIVGNQKTIQFNSSSTDNNGANIKKELISTNPDNGANNKNITISPNSDPIKKEKYINPNNGVNSKEISINPNSGAIKNEISINPKEYQTYLKNRLDIACAKIKASIPANSQSPQESTSANLNMSSNVQEKDDELEGVEEEMTQNTRSPYSEDAKKMRRLLQNRESARRSRKKKQVQENEIEKQVDELKKEQESKTKLAIELSHKFSEELVNNRVLEAKIETLKAKVKMAEETLRRVNPSSFYDIMEKQNAHCFPLVAYNTPSFNSSSSMDPSFVFVQHEHHRQQYFLPSSNTYQPNHGRHEKK